MMQDLTRARAGSAAERLHPRVNVLTQMLPVTLRLKNNWILPNKILQDVLTMMTIRHSRDASGASPLWRALTLTSAVRGAERQVRTTASWGAASSNILRSTCGPEPPRSSIHSPPVIAENLQLDLADVYHKRACTRVSDLPHFGASLTTD
jgi:hypothetical protein